MLVKAFSIILAGSFIVGAGALGYMASDRDLPVDTFERKAVTGEVRPGSDFEFRVRLKERKRCFIHSDRILYDGNGYRHLLPPVEFQAGIGGGTDERDYIVKVPVPTSAAFGTARFEVNTIYKCNILHWVWPIYSHSVLEFQVVPL